MEIDQLKCDDCQRNLVDLALTVIYDEDFDLEILFQPLGRKDCWDNCAWILSRLNGSRLRKHIPKMLVWIQDMNWPGSETILNRLIFMRISFLIDPLFDAIDAAERENDLVWLGWLAIFLRLKGIYDRIDDHRKQLLIENSEWGDDMIDV